MKYSLLLTGKNKIIKEEFFSYLWAEFECLTCSGLYEDIRNHLRYFLPDALVYCMHKEEQVHMQYILSMKDMTRQDQIPLIIIGDREECAAFAQYAPGYADLVLEKPISSSKIADQIIRYLDEKKKDEKPEGLILDMPEEKAKEERPARNHILVIDDDPLMLKMMKEQLRDRYDVATAISGKIARRFLASRKTDLILLDYEMPEENGPMVLEQLRGEASTKDIPVVFLTGIVERGKIEKALKLKPQGYLLKPIVQDKLIETIEKVLG